MTKKIILEEALELFTGKGYIGTSMDDIAKAVGIRKASLYSHYEGKESIFTAIFQDILEEYKGVIRSLTRLNEGDHTVEALRSIFTTFLTYCQGNLKMYFWDRYYYYPPEFMKDIIQKKTLETHVEFMEAIRHLFEKGMEEGQIRKQPPQNPATAYYYLMIGLSMSVRLYDGEGIQKSAKEALDGFFTGVVL